MPIGSNDMHYYAQHEAVNAGPREFNVRGSTRLGYGLTKAEIKRLFQQKGYNVTTGSRWRSTILEWKNPYMYGDVVSIDDHTLMNKRETSDWCIVFVLLSDEEQTYLLESAKRAGLTALPKELRVGFEVCAV